MKRSVKTLIMLLVLVLLLGGYMFLQQQNQKTAASQETGTFNLVEKTADDVQAMRWTRSNVDYHFSRESGSWQRVDIPEFPCKTSELDTMVNSLMKIVAHTKLENVENISAYGLDEPQFSATVTWKDGTETIYYMGDATPFEDGYYMQLSGQENTIYVVKKSLSAVYYKAAVELAQAESIPQLENVNRIVTSTGIDGTKRESSSTLNEEDLWYDTRTGEVLNSYNMDVLVDYVLDLRWQDLPYPVSDEDLRAHLQLDDQATTVTLYENDEIALTLHLGRTIESNSLCYVRLNDSGIIYAVALEDVQSLLNTTMETLYRRTLAADDLNTLTQFTLAFDDQSWQFDVTETEATEEAALHVTLNGEAADPAVAEDLWEQFTDLKPSGRGTLEGSEEALLTITATRGSTAHVYTFYPHSATKYKVQMPDNTVLLLSADDVDTIIRTLKTL